MPLALAWDGGLAAFVALDRALASGKAALLAPASPHVPADVLDAQVRLTGLPLAGPGDAARAPDVSDADVAAAALAERHRAVVVAARPPLDESCVGRFVDEEGLVAEALHRGARLAGDGAAWATLVVESPRLARRLDVVALDVVREGDGWRLDVALAAC